ncbi:MAG: preprotein translocase subunit SecE [Desulfurellaceae bacterium]|jgi:preprotein translocase subunit SecE|nr:preprotein translocase subunit SecE [Desulfurellaceae bacterium]
MNIVEKIRKFLLEVRSEIKKVVWPEKRNLFSATIAVVIFIIIVTVILSVLDYIFSIIAGMVFK